jgi:signal recognition particle subunit SRP9
LSHFEGGRVLNIGAQCVKFKTGSSIFLNRFEAFNLSMMEKIQNSRPKVSIPEPPSMPAPQAMPTGSTGDGGVQSAPVAAGGVKKKKPKKKK